MKKIIFLLFIIILLVGCKSTEIWNNYYSFSTNQQEIKKIISFHGDVKNISDENSYLDEIVIIEKKKNKKEFIKILSNTILIETEKGRYNVKNLNKSDMIKIYDQGTKINSDEFTVYIGKVQLDNGEIIDLPPIKFKRYVYVYKINKLMDALKQDTKESLFEGTIEEYREWKKKNK